MKMSQVYAKHLGARISAKKVAPVLNLVRGKDVKEANIALRFDSTKAAEMVLKVLKSAAANAKHNTKLAADRTFVSEAWVGAGPTLHRMRLVAKSRVSPIEKRTANIYIGLSERTEEKKKLKEKAAR
jgi:large subunit ribosomal protein L22